MNDQRLSILILAAAGMATTFMPWMKVPLKGYVVGTDYSGWITFVLFLVIFLLNFTGNKAGYLSQMKMFGLIMLSLVAAVIGAWTIIDLDGPLASVEYGLYLMTLLGLIIPLAAFIAGKGKNRPEPDSDTDEFSYKTQIDKKGAPD